MSSPLSAQTARGTEVAPEDFSGAGDGTAASSSAATVLGVLESAVGKDERAERSTEDAALAGRMLPTMAEVEAARQSRLAAARGPPTAIPSQLPPLQLPPPDAVVRLLRALAARDGWTRTRAAVDEVFGGEGPELMLTVGYDAGNLVRTCSAPTILSAKAHPPFPRTRRCLRCQTPPSQARCQQSPGGATCRCHATCSRQCGISIFRATIASQASLDPPASRAKRGSLWAL